MISYDSFLKHCQSTFRVEAEPGITMELTLIEVGKLKRSATLEAYSIRFRGPPHRMLPQQIHSFEHSELGTFDLFIVPIGQDASGFYYEAVFNRLVSTN